MAPSELALIIARLGQGLGAALTQPLALANATAIVGPERRGWAIGVLASAGTTCLALGPLVGGLLVETVGWRWIFALNVPLVALALALSFRFMPESRAEDAPALDLPGLVLLTVGLGALVAGLLHMYEWPAGLAGSVLALGSLALAGFVTVEQRSRHPLLPLRLLRIPAVAGSLSSLMAIQGAVLGVTVYVVLYLQNGLGLTALEAGLVLLPAAVWSPLLSTRTGRLADRRGARLPVGVGLIVAGAGLGVLAIAADSEVLILVILGLLMFGLSRPFVFTPASTGPVKAIAPEQRGLASSLVTESRQLGAVLGVAALGSVVVAFDTDAATGASGAGLGAAMLVAAAVCLVTAAAALVLIPEAPRRVDEGRKF